MKVNMELEDDDLLVQTILNFLVKRQFTLDYIYYNRDSYTLRVEVINNGAVSDESICQQLEKMDGVKHIIGFNLLSSPIYHSGK